MEGLEMVAELMAVSTRAAPKSAGKNFVDIKTMYRIGTVARGMGLCDWEYVKGNILFMYPLRACPKDKL